MGPAVSTWTRSRYLHACPRIPGEGGVSISPRRTQRTHQDTGKSIMTIHSHYSVLIPPPSSMTSDLVAHQCLVINTALVPFPPFVVAVITTPRDVPRAPGESFPLSIYAANFRVMSLSFILTRANSSLSRPRSFIPPSFRPITHPWPSRSTSITLAGATRRRKHRYCLYWSQLSRQAALIQCRRRSPFDGTR